MTIGRENGEESAFEAYLEGGSELSQVYRRSAQDEPSKELDARVLEWARRTGHPALEAMRSALQRPLPPRLAVEPRVARFLERKPADG